jgi:hypothetical protein
MDRSLVVCSFQVSKFNEFKMTITTTQTLNQKAAKKGGKERAPIIPKENAPFTLGQIKGAIPPHLFKHSMLVRLPSPSFYLFIRHYIYYYALIIEFLLFASLLRFYISISNAFHLHGRRFAAAAF